MANQFTILLSRVVIAAFGQVLCYTRYVVTGSIANYVGSDGAFAKMVVILSM